MDSILVRRSVFNMLQLHYIELDQKYDNPNDIYTEAMTETKATNPEKHYKFHIYTKLNPNLLPSPFLTCPYADSITRFRCGSHHLPIESLRWSRVARENRLCGKCCVLGDEYHFIFHCLDFPGYFRSCIDNLSAIWKHNDLFRYFIKLSKSEYMRSY